MKITTSTKSYNALVDKIIIVTGEPPSACLQMVRRCSKLATTDPHSLASIVRMTLYRNQGKDDRYASNSFSKVVVFILKELSGEYMGDRMTHSTHIFAYTCRSTSLANVVSE